MKKNILIFLIIVSILFTGIAFAQEGNSQQTNQGTNTNQNILSQGDQSQNNQEAPSKDQSQQRLQFIERVRNGIKQVRNNFRNMITVKNRQFEYLKEIRNSIISLKENPQQLNQETLLQLKALKTEINNLRVQLREINQKISNEWTELKQNKEMKEFEAMYRNLGNIVNCQKSKLQIMEQLKIKLQELEKLL